MNDDLIKTRWQLIPVVGELVENEVMWSEKPSIEQIHQLVDGLLRTHETECLLVLAAFDAVKDPDNLQLLDMFVDELARDKDLPLNPTATAIFETLMWEKRGWAATSKQRAMPEPEDNFYIAGPAVLFDRQVWSW